MEKLAKTNLSSVDPHPKQVRGEPLSCRRQRHSIASSVVESLRQCARCHARWRCPPMEADNVVLDKKDSVWKPEPVSGPHVVLTVSDTGLRHDRGSHAARFRTVFTHERNRQRHWLGPSTVKALLRVIVASPRSLPKLAKELHSDLPAFHRDRRFANRSVGRRPPCLPPG